MSWSVMEGHLSWAAMDEGWRKGPWTAEEDRLLIEYVRLHGEGRWNSVSRLTGLRRNGKSCRLRWVNYLRPDLKKGQITPHEENIILQLHARWGNRWSTIARSLPGRTDNEIKNYWRTHFKKKGKVSSDNTEKSKARLLRKQQFFQLQQQQQQQLLQQQQQQQSLMQIDMQRIMSLFEESENSTSSPPLVRQEMGNTYSNAAEEQGYFCPVFNSDTSTSDEASNEDIVWDSLWNLDDIYGDFNAASATSKANPHTLVAPFYGM